MDNNESQVEIIEHESHADYLKIDVMLKMTINKVVKDEENMICICSYKPISNNINSKLYNHCQQNKGYNNNYNNNKNNINNTNNTNTISSTHTNEQEIIPGLKVPLNKNSKIHELELSTIVGLLKKIGYPLSEALFQVYNFELKHYISFGNEIKQALLSNENHLMHNNVVKLQCTCYIDETYNPSFGENDLPVNVIEKVNMEDNNTKIQSIKKKKKSKESKVGYVIEKVNQWRKLFNGYINNRNEFVKLSLDSAAKELNISKKTLDDFLRQLRLGRKLGYDFNKNISQHVGDLRDHVKKSLKKLNKSSSKSSSNNSNSLINSNSIINPNTFYINNNILESNKKKSKENKK